MTLDDLLVWPPLASLISVFIAAGIWWLGDQLAVRIWSSPEPIERAAGFVVSVAILAAIIHALALNQFIPLWLIRSLASILIVLGARQLYLFLHPPFPYIADALKANGRLDRLSLILCIVTVAALFLAALGPATDADSLDYHLGVPLDWLSNGGAYAREDWLHARLVGIGEAINLLGLGAGTDNLGAVLQFSGMIVAWVAISSLATNTRARILGSLLVLTCPLLMYLVPTQKPQLLPAAALALGLILIVRETKFNPRTIVIAITCVAYAVANKYSFLLSGSVVLLYLILHARKNGELQFTLGVLSIMLLLLAGPGMVRNLLFYGDPVSPLLERFFPGGEEYVIRFSEYLRTTGGGVNLARLVQLPLEWTVSPNHIVGSNVLGIGLLAFLTIKNPNSQSKTLLLCAIIMIFLVLALSQPAARFIFEPYLLIAAAVVVSNWNNRKRGFQYALVAQAGLVAMMAIYVGGTLFPGALNETQRNRVMGSVALHYNATRWLDEVLPEGALLLSPLRVNAILPSSFRASDERKFLPVGDYRARLQKISLENKTLVWMDFYPSYKHSQIIRPGCIGHVISGPKQFDFASRNPLVRRNRVPENWIVMELNLDHEGCDLTRQ